MSDPMAPAIELFAQRGWTPADFQLRAWRAYLAGKSGLVHAATGSGKTLAVWMGPLLNALQQSRHDHGGIRAMWITPLRALASDTAQNLETAITDLGLKWKLQIRTGDTSSYRKKKQRTQLPEALVTTPESLSMLLSYPESAQQLSELRTIIVDEWHELMGGKRGVQTELCLARLRTLNPSLRTWGLSATLANLEEAMGVLLGKRGAMDGELVTDAYQRKIELQTILPESVERFTWSGHLGMSLLPQVLEVIESSQSCLLFVNTRSQAEIWFQSLLKHKPEMIGQLAVHHGSVDKKVRLKIEEMLREGTIRCVVCTSSLDLGVDFAPVERVLQLGSPKGVGRLIQRAGRSGHQPGKTSVVLGVPTNGFELVEYAGAREAMNSRKVEPRFPLRQCIDVLVQHLVTVACGSGFDEEQMLEEVRDSFAYSDLSEADWTWALDFVRGGGPALKAYAEFARIRLDDDTGLWRISTDKAARMHRFGIGTIASDAEIEIRMMNGKRLGTLEESYISKLTAGQNFFFGGRILTLVRVRDMTAYVRPAKKQSGAVPRWGGGRFPMSTELARVVRQLLERARDGDYPEPEMAMARPILELQRQWSILPASDEILVERTKSRYAEHYFVFPFLGRLAHEGLAALLLHRLTQRYELTITSIVNDYGLEIVGQTLPEIREDEWRELMHPQNLEADLLQAVNASQLARRRFRQIAQVAGLIVNGPAHMRKTLRHLQASSELFYQVFCDFDPSNALLAQARREVLEHELELSRMQTALNTLSDQKIVIKRTERLTPFSFPLWADSIQQQKASSVGFARKVAEMAERLEMAAKRSDVQRERHARQKQAKPSRQSKAPAKAKHTS